MACVACERERARWLAKDKGAVEGHVPEGDQHRLALVHAPGRHVEDLPRPRELLVDIVSGGQLDGEPGHGVERRAFDRPRRQLPPLHGDKIGPEIGLGVCQHLLGTLAEGLAVRRNGPDFQQPGRPQSAGHRKPRPAQTAIPLRIRCPYRDLKRSPHPLGLPDLHCGFTVFELLLRGLEVVAHESGNRLRHQLKHLGRCFLPRQRFDSLLLVRPDRRPLDDLVNTRLKLLGCVCVQCPPIVGDRCDVGADLLPHNRIEIQHESGPPVCLCHRMQLLG